jgi:hypothetical protein
MNALNLLADCDRESKLIARMLKDSMTSFNRHGDFVVARSACHRLADRLSELIDLEEGEEVRFRAFEAPLPAAIEPATPRAQGPRKKEPSAPINPKPVNNGLHDGGTTAEMIMAALKKRPMTAQELHVALLKLRPSIQIGSIYSACSLLKKAGDIGNRVTEDDSDFVRRYYLPEKH